MFWKVVAYTLIFGSAAILLFVKPLEVDAYRFFQLYEVAGLVILAVAQCTEDSQ